MKITFDERLKHRLTGLVVIVSIAIIFVPAMIKRSNQRLEESINVSIQLPPKPVAPEVNVSKKEAIFDSIKVAHVDIPAPQRPIAREVPSEIAQIAEPVQKMTEKAAPVVVKMDNPVPVKALPQQLAKTIAIKQGRYGVQLASFGQQVNAEALVKRLKNQGYQANYNKVQTRQGAFYKVVVGQLAKRNEAEILQKKLAQNLQLRGFVVESDA